MGDKGAGGRGGRGCVPILRSDGKEEWKEEGGRAGGRAGGQGEGVVARERREEIAARARAASVARAAAAVMASNNKTHRTRHARQRGNENGESLSVKSVKIEWLEVFFTWKRNYRTLGVRK